MLSRQDQREPPAQASRLPDVEMVWGVGGGLRLARMSLGYSHCPGQRQPLQLPGSGGHHGTHWGTSWPRESCPPP